MTYGRHRTFLVAVALVLPACGGSPADRDVATPGSSRGDVVDGASDTQGGTSDSADVPARQSAGTQLLSFSAPAIGGGTITAADFRGRPTLLWFWAPW